MLALGLQQVKTKYELIRHNTSTSKRIFTTRGRVWPMKPLDPDYLEPKHFLSAICICKLQTMQGCSNFDHYFM